MRFRAELANVPESPLVLIATLVVTSLTLQAGSTPARAFHRVPNIAVDDS